MKEATVIDPNALKNSSYEYFEFYFKKMVKNRLQTTIKKSKKIVYSTSTIENKTRKRELSSAFFRIKKYSFLRKLW